MRADDPRHGTEAGCREHYRHGEKPCPPCLADHTRRNKRRRLYPHKVSALGSQRRIRALQAIGWGRDRIANELGYSQGGALGYLMRSQSVLVGTASNIATVYDRLSMVVPIGAGPDRARTWARRHGYAPPLAWDNIDDPDEEPTAWQYTPVDPKNVYAARDVDPVVVMRLLEGVRVKANVAERVEALAQWKADGGSEREFCMIHGWKAGRYGRLRLVEEAS